MPKTVGYVSPVTSVLLIRKHTNNSWANLSDINIDDASKILNLYFMNVKSHLSRKGSKKIERKEGSVITGGATSQLLTCPSKVTRNK